VRSIALVVIAIVISLLSFWIPNDAIAGGGEQQVCNVGADYSLCMEDYSEAIRLHVEAVRKHPDNALAHYHLGFALGMVGHRMAEVSEYQRAQALGLRSWDLFLNLGLAQLSKMEIWTARLIACDMRFSSARITPNRISTSRSSMNGGECWQMLSTKYRRL
jgi:hypothetical protein